MKYYLLVLYITLYYLRPFEWVPLFINTPIYIVVGLLAIIALVPSKNKLFSNTVDYMLLGFAFSMVVSHASHGYLGGITKSMQDFIPVMVGYLLIAHGLDTQKKQEYFVFLLIVLAAILVYEGHLQIINGVAHGGVEPIYFRTLDANGVEYELPRIRWYGFFNDPNDLGLAFVLGIPFLVNMLFNRHYLFPAIFFPILTYGIYLTNSRGTVLAFVVSIFTYLVIRFRSIKGIVLGLILLSCIMLLGPSRMSEMSATEDSAYGRIEAWYNGFQMFKDYPIFGVGKGMFSEYYRLTAHNSYMLVLAELGLFGSFFFIGLFYFPFKWAKYNLIKIDGSVSESERCFIAATLASLTGIMCAMFFLSRSYNQIPFMLIGLFVASIKNSKTFTDNKYIDDFTSTNVYELLVLIAIEILVINMIVKLLL